MQHHRRLQPRRVLVAHLPRLDGAPGRRAELRPGRAGDRQDVASQGQRARGERAQRELRVLLHLRGRQHGVVDRGILHLAGEEERAA
jgi:hypothetical protein